MQLSKFITTLFLIFVTCIICFAQDITLSSQAEVDAFDPNTTTINGELTIGIESSTSTSDIQDLSNLSNLTTVSSLTIRHNDLLQNLDGLSNLTSITGGSVLIADNNNLANVDGLSNLNSIEGSLNFQNNPILGNIDGLLGLTTISGSLVFFQNDLLTNINGLSNLISIGSATSSALAFHYNNSLENLDGLSSLNSIGNESDISVSYNNSLTNIDELSNISTALSEYNISYNPNLENLPSFASITSISYKMDIIGNYSLVNLGNLPNISSIGYLNIENNTALTNIDGLSDLNTIVRRVTIEDNTALENMDGFASLTQIGTEDSPGTNGSSLQIINNSSLNNIDGLSNLLSIGDNLEIKYNESLININGLNSLHTVGSLPNLGSSYAVIEIEYNSSLQNLDGLTALTSIGDNVSTDFSYQHRLKIAYNNSLENINGLSNLNFIKGSLIIRNNPSLLSIDGLSGLQTIGSNDTYDISLDINSNDNLEHLNGLSSLTTVHGTLEIENNDNLQNIDGLVNLTEVKANLRISSNFSLDNINGLSNLERIGSDLNIMHDSLITNLDGLSNLNYIGRSLGIGYNYQLTDISGLSNLTYIGDDLTIWNNEALVNCCGIQNLLITPNAIGDQINLVGNLPSCNSQNSILNEICGNNINIIEGNIFLDDITNCQYDPEDILYENIIIQAKSPEHTFTTVSNALGDYKIHTDTGSYEVLAYMSNPYTQACTSSYFVDILDNTQSDSFIFDFPTIVNTECPYLEVDISTWALRECFDNTYHVKFCNSGTIEAVDAYIEITLDEVLSLADASIPFSGPDTNNIYTFDIENVPVGECGDFNIHIQLPCDTLNTGQFLGQTLCIDAHIYPDSICLPPSSIWDGSSIQVIGECDLDSVRFRVKNVGIGDMLTSKTLHVFEDQVLMIDNPFQLNSGEEIILSYFANGSTFRLDAEQSDGHPGNSHPSVAIEGCGTGTIFSLGFINQFSQDDTDVFVSSECREVTGSYDPNDKQAFPNGYGEEHFIEKNTDIEYLIRFQNTGTDTAFTVVIQDPISPLFDITSIQPGASSHPYTFEIDTVAKFIFNDILLVDSLTNEAASHGFVKFRIAQQPNLPNGTLLENTAKIFFDFNAPIITNTTFHTIGENFITIHIIDGISDAFQISSIKAYPNPFSEVIHFELEGNVLEEIILSVFDVNGRQVATRNYNSSTFQFERGNLVSGIYFYKLSSEGLDIANGKMILK